MLGGLPVSFPSSISCLRQLTAVKFRCIHLYGPIDLSILPDLSPADQLSAELRVTPCLANFTALTALTLHYSCMAFCLSRCWPMLQTLRMLDIRDCSLGQDQQFAHSLDLAGNCRQPKPLLH